MGFVGNYAPYGLSPQIHDMPVILKNPCDLIYHKDYHSSPDMGII